LTASYASTNSTGEKKTSEEETISGNEVKEETKESTQEKPTTDTGYMPVEPDSTANFNTSCKFNFIFYFIYKMKYDDNSELEAKLKYPL
jgi:hypothetical protein